MKTLKLLFKWYCVSFKWYRDFFELRWSLRLSSLERFLSRLLLLLLGLCLSLLWLCRSRSRSRSRPLLLFDELQFSNGNRISFWFGPRIRNRHEIEINCKFLIWWKPNEGFKGDFVVCGVVVFDVELELCVSKIGYCSVKLVENVTNLVFFFFRCCKSLRYGA